MKKYFKTPIFKVLLASCLMIMVLYCVKYTSEYFAFESPKISEGFKKGIDASVNNPKKHRIRIGNKDVTDKYIDEIKKLQSKGQYEEIYNLLGVDKEDFEGLGLSFD